jgi:HEAT repeat protein
MLAAVAACAVILASGVAAANDASVRANAGILMSRSMDVKDRVGAAESLARYSPRAAVPILIEALNETSEPVRRAAARGLWTVAQNENADDAAAARAAMPALRIALGDVSISVAMNAAGALERLGDPASTLADVRRKAWRGHRSRKPPARFATLSATSIVRRRCISRR